MCLLLLLPKIKPRGDTSWWCGVVLFILDTFKYCIKFVPRHRSNSKEECADLWALLKVSLNKNVTPLQLFRDSKMVIDWTNNKIQIFAPHLQHLSLYCSSYTAVIQVHFICTCLLRVELESCWSLKTCSRFGT